MSDSRWGQNKSLYATDNRTRGSEAFLESVANRFRSIGASHILITGMPLPGRDLSKLVLYQRWGEEPMSSTQLAQIRGNDVLLRKVAVLNQPEQWDITAPDHSWLLKSPLINLLQSNAGDAGSLQTLVGIHVHHFSELQLAICIAGSNIAASRRDLTTLANAIQHEMGEQHAVSPFISGRPGGLSVREKLVLGMTAEGKTAGDIAQELEISQRTVHAHLQNASEKMQAANKTQTVVEAMRYGQIQLP